MDVLELSDNQNYDYDAEFFTYTFEKLRQAEDLDEVEWDTAIVDHLTVEEFIGGFMALFQKYAELLDYVKEDRGAEEEYQVDPEYFKELTGELPEGLIREIEETDIRAFQRFLEKKIEGEPRYQEE